MARDLLQCNTCIYMLGLKKLIFIFNTELDAYTRNHIEKDCHYPAFDPMEPRTEVTHVQLRKCTVEDF